jgi:hypothetical protein
MNKLLLIVLSSCALQPVFAMEQSLTLFHKRACVGNLLVRPDGKMLQDFSSSELEDAHPKVLDATHSPFLEEIAFHSKFTGKFWLKKAGLTDEFWHNNSTLPSENVFDDYLIFLAKNGRCAIRKPNKNDLASICAFSSAIHDRRHNWSYLKRLEPISVIAHNNEYAVQVNDERNRESVLWDVFEADIKEDEEGEWLEQLKNEYEDLLHSDGIACSFPRWEWLDLSHVNNVNNAPIPQSRGIYAWCTENPKKTIGLAIGTGVLGWLVYKYYTREDTNPVQQVIQRVTVPMPSITSPVPSVTTALLKQAYDEIHGSLRQQLTRHGHSLTYCYNHGFLTNSFVPESALLQWIKDTAKMKKHW